MKRCNFIVKAINPQLFRVIFSDVQDTFDVSSIITALVPEQIKGISLYHKGDEEFIEIIGADGRRQWKEYVAPWICHDESNNLWYFIMTDRLTFFKPRMVRTYKRIPIEDMQRREMDEHFLQRFYG